MKPFWFLSNSRIPPANRRALERIDATERRTALYWRNAYENLVQQTGRDLNDGLGRDPRSRKP